MSTVVMSACWPLKMPTSPKAVLISLADNANDHGECWPSIPTICQRTCLCRTSVIVAIKWLEDHNLVTVDRQGRSNRYVVTPGAFTGDLEGNFHYVYRITHQPSGMFYLGLRTTAGLPEQDDYWGSGKECVWLDSVRAECQKEILSLHGSRLEAASAETREIIKAMDDPRCLNRKASVPAQAMGAFNGPSGKRTVRLANIDPSVSRTEESVSRTNMVRQVDPNHQEPSRTVIKSNQQKAPACAVDRPEGVSEQTWADWLALRKAKKAPVTATVLKEAKTEAGKAQLPLERFLMIWCSRGSQGLQADWLKPNERGTANGKPSASASFHGKVYTGTAEEDLPPELRERGLI